MSSIHRSKSIDKSLFSQILAIIPTTIFNQCVSKAGTDEKSRCYSTHHQFVSMLFGQLNDCCSLRDITLGLNVNTLFLKELGLGQSPARSTMSDGNAERDAEVFLLLFYELVRYYKASFAKSEHYKVIEGINGQSVKIVDATTIGVCLNLINWAKFRTAKGGIKAHVGFDLAAQIPEMVYVTDANAPERHYLPHIDPDYKHIVVFDRGYLDFNYFKDRIDHHAPFVTRLKSNIRYEVLEERPIAVGCPHILKDEIIKIHGVHAKTTGLERYLLRQVTVFDEKNKREIKLLTANMDWTAETVSQLYRSRWQIELFFKAIKQKLHIKTFLGTSENACKSQIYIAMIAFLLIEIIRKCISKTKHSFSNFVNLIRICLLHYHSLQYVVNDIKQISIKLKDRDGPKYSSPTLFE